MKKNYSCLFKPLILVFLLTFVNFSTHAKITLNADAAFNADLPERVIVGYWHNFDNGSGFIRPENVSSKFDVVNISFAEPVSGSASLIDFTPDPALISDADFRAGIQILQSRGQKVVISIGGANGTVQLNTIAERDEFVTSMIGIIEDYGFDGMDIDFEGQSLKLDFGDDDFRNPTTPRIINLIDAINTVTDHFGNDFILTMAPETFFVQLGYSFYGGISAGADRRAGAYLPVIHALRDKLDFLQVQYYNSGSITALDDQFYAMGNADFYVSLVDMLLKGFPITGDASKFFPALRQDQVLIGLPANFNAGGGFVPPSEVQKALDYLIKGIPYGGNYTLTQSYPNLRGLMTWSINWDAFNNFEFSNLHRAYLDALDGVNPQPTVSITAPSNNDNFITGDPVTISANASDNGAIAQVEFFVNGASLGIDNTIPYSATWSPVTEGIYNITAKATDDEGATTTSGVVSVSISDTLNEAPVANITAPSVGATFDQGTAIEITADATDTDGTVAQVEFFANGESLGTDASEPFSFTWNGAGVGTYVLTAIATDNLGTIGNSTEVTITIEAISTEGCEGIAIWTEGNTYLGGDEVQINGKKYRANWWTQANPEMNNGVTGSGQPWTFLEDCSGDTNQAPDVVITSPASGSSFEEGASILLEASATDDDAVVQVEFFVDGTSIGVDNTRPYSVNWDNGYVGNHSITAVATDNENATGTSVAVSISITDNDPTNEAPIVNITAPLSGVTFDEGTSINIIVDATDTDGTVAKVEFFANGASLGADASEPFSFTWNSTRVGTHALTAIATDNLGAIGNSTQVTITVEGNTPEGCVGIAIWSEGNTYLGGDEVQLNGKKYRANWWTQANPETNNGSTGSGQPWTLLGLCSDNPPPSVSITSPSSGSSFEEGTSILLGASATDDDTVTQVEFFVDGTSIGIDTTSPYSANWNNGVIGDHSITAVATDNENLTTTSLAVTVSITAIPSTISVVLTAPSSGSTFMEGDAILLTADASDTAGNIILVEFFDGTVKLGEDTTAPYEFNWSSGNVGSHALSAIATSDTNEQELSSTVNISITTDGEPSTDLAKHIMVGYWHNFDNGAAVLDLGDVSADWDVVNIAFAEPATPGGADMAFAPSSDVTTDAQFRQDVALLQGRGQKVMISIGGANGRIELHSEEDAITFANAMIAIIENYGFDGMDIDLEGTSLALSAGDTDFRNPTSPIITNFITGTQMIIDHFGADFILSAAPETAYVQGGISTYAGVFGAYLPVIYHFKDRLSYIHVQDYNSGCMLGLDGLCYSQSTADFHVAMTEMLLQGFPVAGHSINFPALRPDQVAFGIPASPQAAGGGYTVPAEVKKALDYLIKGISFGGNYTLLNPSGYPEMRGLMTWSINWDEFFNKEFSSNYRPYFDALLGGNAPARAVAFDNAISFEAFPNPVSTTTNFRLDLQENASVSLRIHNMFGTSIDIASHESLEAGTHEYQWDSDAFPIGMYLAELTVNGVVQMHKIVKN